MTLNPSEAHYVHREFPMFTQWALKHGNPMFLPKGFDDNDDDEASKYDLRSQAYLLMRNLHQSYETIMTLPTEDREFFVRSELKLLEEQKKQNEEINARNGS
jgi:hypothetical protein